MKITRCKIVNCLLLFHFIYFLCGASLTKTVYALFICTSAHVLCCGFQHIKQFVLVLSSLWFCEFIFGRIFIVESTFNPKRGNIAEHNSIAVSATTNVFEWAHVHVNISVWVCVNLCLCVDVNVCHIICQQVCMSILFGH